MRNKLPVIGLVAGLTIGSVGGLALGVPGLVGAQTTTTTPDATTPSTTAPGAEARPDRTQWTTDALAPLVADGTITQAQADAVTKALEAARPQGDGHGPRGGFMRASLETAATAIGIDVEALRTALQGGQTLAQVAEANGKDAQVVIGALVAEAKTRLDAKVADGTITQAEADTKLTEATERATAVVNGELPARPDGDFGGRGPRRGWGGGPGGTGGTAPATPATPAAPTTTAA